MTNRELILKLKETKNLSHGEFVSLLSTYTKDDSDFARSLACETSKKYFGNRVFVRGLIEFSSICKNDCLYCGLRASNSKAERYRLSSDDILKCCAHGYSLGFRTFVLQGGEDPYFTDDKICDIVAQIKKNHPDCAVTLSLGERDYASFLEFFNAGADRYLLRHETANREHYSKLHPETMSFERRVECLKNLKKIGFQTGCGFMVGSPFQTPAYLADDLLFIRELNPEMCGIGPFIPHKDTPFGGEVGGTLDLTLFLLALVRLMLGRVLLPSTTALGTIDPNGREMGILSGANIVMPNLSPIDVRKKYMLYDNKICTGDEAAECLKCLGKRMSSIGYEIVSDRGDYPKDTCGV